MKLVEEMICETSKKIRGTLIINLQRHEVAASYAIEDMIRYISQLKDLITLQQASLGKSAVNFDSLIERFNTIRINLLLDGVLISAKHAIVLVDEFESSLSTAEIDLINKSNNLLNNVKEQKQIFSDLISGSQEIDLKQPWRRAKYKDLIREKAGADWFDVSLEVRRQRAHDLGAEITKDYTDFEVTGAVFEKLIEPTLIQPTFVTHLPKELVPLAKISPDDPSCVEVFECCINGQEISPGYTEQNDPIEQRERLEHQAGGEQQKLDEDFLIALEHGMPPAGGIGIGIDRLCMMLLGQESIRDVILFPQLKPK
jgi:lysyl-tRNA synthetase class II